jgi:hypothetical protein
MMENKEGPGVGAPESLQEKGLSGRAYLIACVTARREELIFVQGRIVGKLQGATFTKKLRRSKHYLRTPGGWGHDRESLLELQAKGCRIIRIIDLDSGTIYCSPIETMLSRGIRINRGYGEQVLLLECLWTQSDPRQSRLFEERLP